MKYHYLSWILSLVICFTLSSSWAQPIASKEAKTSPATHSQDQLHQKTTPSKTLEATLPPANTCLLYTSPSPRDATLSRMPSSA